MIRGFFLILLLLACFALSPAARAVLPPPDGCYPNSNTAEGTNALFSLIVASDLGSNGNTAIGARALFRNTTGSSNTAIGADALNFNTADNNTATGAGALYNNTTGSANTVTGVFALGANRYGNRNTVYGANALSHSDGNNNIAVGERAGSNLTKGSDNIYVGNLGAGETGKIRIGTAGTQTATFIAGITGVAVTGAAVLVSGDGQLGVRPSSQRFKQGIKPMDNASEAILALKPVTFRYKKDIDPDGIPQFGLVAEEVAEVNPDLVARDAEGKIYTVRYEAVNAMLLNEFLKEHRKVEQQEATIAQLKDGMKVLTASLKEQAAQIQKVNDKVELSRPAPQMVSSNH